MGSGERMEWAIVACFLVVSHGFFMLFCFSRLEASVWNGLDDMDEKIAKALRSLVEQGLGDFEPINPIQQAIAHFITNRVNEGPIEARIVEHGQDGKFV